MHREGGWRIEFTITSWVAFPIVFGNMADEFREIR